MASVPKIISLYARSDKTSVTLHHAGSLPNLLASDRGGVEEEADGIRDEGHIRHEPRRLLAESAPNLYISTRLIVQPSSSQARLDKDACKIASIAKFWSFGRVQGKRDQ